MIEFILEQGIVFSVCFMLWIISTLIIVCEGVLKPYDANRKFRPHKNRFDFLVVVNFVLFVMFFVIK